MKRSFFDIIFGPAKQPGYEARNRSVDHLLTGGASITGGYKEPVNLGIDPNNLNAYLNPVYHFNSGTVDQTLPSRILYRKGWKP